MKIYLDTASALPLGKTKLERTPDGGVSYEIANEESCGVAFTGEKGRIGGVEWKRELFLSYEIENDAQCIVHTTTCFFKGNPPDYQSGGYAIAARSQIMPGIGMIFTLPLTAFDSASSFMPVIPGSSKTDLGGRPSDPADCTAFVIRNSLLKPHHRVKPVRVTIKKVWLSDKPEYGTYGPVLVDELGQAAGLEWPGKTHGLDEMKENLRSALADAEKDDPALTPASRSAYGGWTEKRFEATGWFRTQYDGRRWWLVDPDGCAFISCGMAYGSRMGDFGWVTGFEKHYAWLPAKDDPLYSAAWTTADKIPEFAKRNGKAAGEGKWLFNFQRANLIRTFGEGWWDAWTKIAVNRFKRWGVNTIGVGVNNFEDENVEGFLRQVKIPYTITFKRFPVTEHFLYRDMPDVFSDEFAEGSKVFARQILPWANDPYMIGYFINNEPEWLFMAGVNKTEQMLMKDYPFASRRKFIEFLSERYGGDIGALNRAWNASFASFEDFMRPVKDVCSFSESSMRDAWDFDRVLVTAFGEIPSAEIKKLDPHHLNLGMRYGGSNLNTCVHSDYFDVFSFNCYAADPYEKVEEIGRVMNMPVIIGEFHHGGADRGMFRGGLRTAPTQTARGNTYRFYMEAVVGSKYGAGAHYFEYNDQPLLGRFDGEAMQHGVIDCCNKPYDDMIAYISDANRRIYHNAEALVRPMYPLW